MVSSGFRRFGRLYFINQFGRLYFINQFSKKNEIGWPQQPPTEKVSDISEKLDFDDPFQKKGLVLVI